MTAPANPHRLQGIVLAGVGAVAFSGKAIIVKLAYRYGVDAVTILMYRMLFAFPLFITLSWWAGRGKPPLTGRDWLLLGGLGFSGYYLASYLDFAGLQYISANLERIILYLNPTIVLAVSALAFHVKVKPRQWGALVVSYLGVLVVFGHDISLQGDNVALGSLLVLGAAVSYALYLLFSGQAVKRLGPLRITGGATSIACVLCIAQFFVLRTPADMVVAPEVVWLSLLNATFCTFLPVLVVMFAIQRVGPPVVSQVGIIGPISTILLSVLLLDEPFTIWVGAGTAIALFGVWLLTRRK
ncbi:MAG: DMT family transporter [Gammaproteobacteria bacterium]